MRIALKQADTARIEDNGFEELFNELWNLHRSLPLDKYLNVVERFVDEARESLDRLEDHAKREELREQYRQVIEYAVDLACVPVV